MIPGFVLIISAGMESKNNKKNTGDGMTIYPDVCIELFQILIR